MLAKDIYNGDSIEFESSSTSLPKILVEIRKRHKKLTRKCTERDVMFKLVQQIRGGKPKAKNVEDYAFTPEMAARWARLVLIKLGYPRSEIEISTNPCGQPRSSSFQSKL